MTAFSEIFGRREILLLSIGFFTLGSLIACLAHNIPTLLAGRTVQGIGGGGIIAMNLVVLTDLVPLRQRPKYTGISQMTWAFGTIAGPLIGGSIAEYTTWRWLFYVNFPFCGLGLLTVPFVVKLDAQRDQIATKLAAFDWTGSLMFIGSTTTFLIGLTWGGHDYAWGSYQTLLPLCLGVLGIAGTGCWEALLAKKPFVQRSMLRNRSLMTTYLCTVLQGLMLYACVYYLALYFLSVQGRTPLKTGILMLPISFSLLPGSALVGLAVSRSGTWRWAVWTGWVVNTFAMGLLILVGTQPSVTVLVLIFLVLGMGQGLLLSAHNFAVQAIAKVEDVASATALFAFMRGLGLCFGVAIGGTIFENRLKAHLVSSHLPVSIADDAEGYSIILRAMPKSAQKEAIITAFAQSFKQLFIVLVALSAGALLLSLTIKGHYSLDKELKTDHVLRDERPGTSDSSETV